MLTQFLYILIFKEIALAISNPCDILKFAFRLPETKASVIARFDAVKSWQSSSNRRFEQTPIGVLNALQKAIQVA
ncbi:MAG: hypothetical protein J6W29_09365 [Neisseriaceae bacterium]|nr:hypothetical protein [Neisseriaceae bacterium]